MTTVPLLTSQFIALDQTFKLYVSTADSPSPYSLPHYKEMAFLTSQIFQESISGVGSMQPFEWKGVTYGKSTGQEITTNIWYNHYFRCLISRVRFRLQSYVICSNGTELKYGEKKQAYIEFRAEVPWKRWAKLAAGQSFRLVTAYVYPDIGVPIRDIDTYDGSTHFSRLTSNVKKRVVESFRNYILCKHYSSSHSRIEIELLTRKPTLSNENSK